jgi:hypothetical protein
MHNIVMLFKQEFCDYLAVSIVYKRSISFQKSVSIKLIQLRQNVPGGSWKAMMHGMKVIIQEKKSEQRGVLDNRCAIWNVCRRPMFRE